MNIIRYNVLIFNQFLILNIHIYYKKEFKKNMNSQNSTRHNSECEDESNLIQNNIDEQLNQNNNNNFKIPSNLKKTFYCIIILSILGIILLIFGIEELLRKNDIKTFICLLILSIIVLIPGLYYLYQFYKAYKEEDEEKRNEILNDIPVMEN